MRGYGQARWQRARALALKRAGNRCQRCRGTRNLRVHHRDGQGMAGRWATHPPNLVVLCQSCHMIAHGKMMSDDDRTLVVIPSYRRE